MVSVINENISLSKINLKYESFIYFSADYDELWDTLMNDEHDDFKPIVTV